MLKSQIKNTTTTAYPKIKKCKAFLANKEGIGLMIQYLLSQWSHPFGMELELIVTKKPGYDTHWDVTYIIYARNGSETIEERLFRLYEHDGCINVPTVFPRLTRTYILEDIRKDGFCFVPSADQLEREQIRDLQRAVAPAVRSATHLDLSHLPPCTLGEHVGRGEVEGLLPSTPAHNALADFISDDPDKRRAVMEEIKGKGGVGYVDIPQHGFLREPTYATELPKSPSGLHNLNPTDPNFPDLSTPIPGEDPQGIVSQEMYDRIIEQKVKELKEKYPDISEEQIRNDLVNMTKE